MSLGAKNHWCFDCFCCDGGVINSDVLVNTLMKKCVNPQRKSNIYELVSNHGRQSDTGVSNS